MMKPAPSNKLPPPALAACTLVLVCLMQGGKRLSNLTPSLPQCSKLMEVFCLMCQQQQQQQRQQRQQQNNSLWLGSEWVGLTLLLSAAARPPCSHQPHLLQQQQQQQQQRQQPQQQQQQHQQQQRTQSQTPTPQTRARSAMTQPTASPTSSGPAATTTHATPAPPLCGLPQCGPPTSWT
jgi:hypothetical protein